MRQALDPNLHLSRKIATVQPIVQSVGQLTGIDGAVVINEDLDVLAFGVMLRSEASDAEKAVLIYEVGLETSGTSCDSLPRSPLSQLGGARHRSAAEFCSRFPQSLAFVVSLTIFGSVSQTQELFAIRKAELVLL